MLSTQQKRCLWSVDNSKSEFDWVGSSIISDKHECYLQVLAGRQEQIQDKMVELRRQQEESIARREELLKDMEKANQLTQREREQTARQKEIQRDALSAQV